MPLHSRYFFYSLVLATGQGLRAQSQGEPPKQYQKIQGYSVLSWSLRPFLNTGIRKKHALGSIYCSLRPEHHTLFQNALSSYEHANIHPLFLSTSERQESVKEALLLIKADIEHSPQHSPSQEAWIIIHDAARPNVALDSLSAALSWVEKHGQAVAFATPLTDSLVLDNVNESRPQIQERTHLKLIQTPQIFPLKELSQAHCCCAHNFFTDDSSLFLSIGRSVHYDFGDKSNLKFTEKSDRSLLEVLIQQRN